MTRQFKTGHLIATGMVFIILTTFVKVYFSAQDEHSHGQQSLAEGDTFRAVEHFERAIRWHMPLGSTADEAAQQIWNIGEQHVSKGENQKALSAFRRLRAAFYGSRSFYTPGGEWITECNEKIAELMSINPPLTQRARSLSQEQRRQEYLELLSKERPPNRGWTLVSQLVFFGWIVCLFLFIFRALTPQGEIRLKPALAFSAGWGLCFSIWVFALSQI